MKKRRNLHQCISDRLKPSKLKSNATMPVKMSTSLRELAATKFHPNFTNPGVTS